MELEKKRANLICKYSLNLRKGDILFVRTETVSETLIKEICAKTIDMSGFPVPHSGYVSERIR